MPRTRATFLPRRAPPTDPQTRHVPRGHIPYHVPSHVADTEHGLARVTPPHPTAPTYTSTRAHTLSRAHTP
eukprot:7080239-Prymnesium_polylepis.1